MDWGPTKAVGTSEYTNLRPARASKQLKYWLSWPQDFTASTPSVAFTPSVKRPLVGDVLSIHPRPGRPKSGCQCHLHLRKYFKGHCTQQGVLMYTHPVFYEITLVKAHKACSDEFPKLCFKIRESDNYFYIPFELAKPLIKALCWLQHAISLHYPKTAQR